MLLAYVDESFDDERYDLGAILITPAAAKALEIALDDLARGIVAAHPGLVGPMEFHGYEIFHAARGWRHLRPQVRARVRAYRRIVELVLTHADAIVVKSVRATRVRATSTSPLPASRVAWGFLLKDTDAYSGARGDLALVIADEVPEDEQRRRELAEYKSRGSVDDDITSNMPSILDTVYFGPSHHSRLIQAVDCVLFILHRHGTVTTGDPRQLVEVDTLCGAIQASGRLLTSGIWP